MRKTQWLSYIGRHLANLGGILLCAATLMAFGNVVTRKVLSHPFSWSDELVGFLSVWVVYLPLVLMETDNGHLRVTVLYDACSARVRWWLDRLQDMLIIGMLASMAYIGGTLVQNNLELHVSSPTLHIPMGILYAIIPVSFGLAAITRLLGLFEALFSKTHGREVV